MKKLFWILFLVICFVLIVVCVNNDDKEIRVRIIPNSNSSEDISVKYEVKEDIINYLNEVYDASRDKMIENIKESIDDLSILLNEKYSKVDVVLEKHNFYNKEYNDNVLLNKKVLALVIKIGDADGDNWWGSIYPELLGMDSAEQVEYKSFIKEIIDKWLK